jgi:hypothetical protein
MDRQIWAAKQVAFGFLGSILPTELARVRHCYGSPMQ